MNSIITCFKDEKIPRMYTKGIKGKFLPYMQIYML